MFVPGRHSLTDWRIRGGNMEKLHARTDLNSAVLKEKEECCNSVEKRRRKDTSTQLEKS
jgi:hypothetical protein